MRALVGRLRCAGREAAIVLGLVVVFGLAARLVPASPVIRGLIVLAATAAGALAISRLLARRRLRHDAEGRDGGPGSVPPGVC